MLFRSMKLQYIGHLMQKADSLEKTLMLGKIDGMPTKVRLVKAMVFPVVMYGCKSWIIKKAEC